MFQLCFSHVTSVQPKVCGRKVKDFRLFRLALSLVALATSIVLTAVAHGEENSDRVCTGYTGYHPDNPWYLVGTTEPKKLSENCPDQQAFVSALPPGGNRRDSKFINIHGTCCPLPPDALLDLHQYALEECPAGYVATGAKQEPLAVEAEVSKKNRNQEKFWSNGRLQYLRCTKINDSKYRLTPATNGVAVGGELHFRNIFSKRSQRSAMPVAFRYGLGRLGHARWSETICAGLPWGALLVGKTSKYCEGYRFSELKLIDINENENWRYYPECLFIENPLSKKPRCVRE